MKKNLLFIALIVGFVACKKEDAQPLGLVGNITPEVDTTFLAGRDSISWQYISRVRGGVFEQTSQCNRTQSFTYRRDGFYHFYSLPGSPCDYGQVGTTDQYHIKGDSLILGLGTQASHRLKVVKLAQDTLRLTFTDLNVVYVDTYVPHQ